MIRPKPLRKLAGALLASYLKTRVPETPAGIFTFEVDGGLLHEAGGLGLGTSTHAPVWQTLSSQVVPEPQLTVGSVARERALGKVELADALVLRLVHVPVEVDANRLRGVQLMPDAGPQPNPV